MGGSACSHRDNRRGLARLEMMGSESMSPPLAPLQFLKSTPTRITASRAAAEVGHPDRGLTSGHALGKHGGNVVERPNEDVPEAAFDVGGRITQQAVHLVGARVQAQGEMVAGRIVEIPIAGYVHGAS